MPTSRTKIKRCPECKNEVSYSAKTCPVCGHDFQQEHKPASPPLEILEKYKKKEKRKRSREEVFSLNGITQVTALLFYLYGLISIFYGTIAFPTHIWWWIIWLYVLGLAGFAVGSLFFAQRNEAILAAFILVFIGSFTFLGPLIILGSTLAVMTFIVRQSKKEVIVTDKDKN